MGRTALMADTSFGTTYERSLVRRLCEGDETALGELYDGYGPFVFGLALRVVRDRSAADDIAQDVFVQMWQQPERFDPTRGSLRSFLATVTHRRAIDHVRREEARRRRETNSVVGEITPYVEARLEHDDRTEAVREAVAALPNAQREALELAYYHGYTYRRVATLLDIPEGTAKSRLRLAIARIAKVLRPVVQESPT
jgi:RNA polymerase sigma-70 factor (ECF subfamily)